MRFALQSGLDHHSEYPSKNIQPGDRQAQVIAIAAQKGGVGKTTTAVSLGAALARNHGKRVLIVDLDPQCHVDLALHSMIEAGGGALSDILTEPMGLEVEEIVTGTTIDNLFVTPADPQLVRAEDRLASRIGKELVLREALELTRTHYDIILLDCPPNMGTLTVNGLVAADGVVIPSNPAALAVSGVEGLMSAVREIRARLNPELKVLGMVLTRVDGRNSTTNEIIEQMVREAWGDLLMPIQIGVANSLSKAQLEGRDIFDIDPTGRGAEQYSALAQCVLERLEG